jgi:hypothetical protein
MEQNFEKIIKAGLHAYFNMKNTLNGWINILNSKMEDMT